MNIFRKMLVLAVNELIYQKIIDLNSIENIIEGHIKTKICQKEAVILWRSIGGDGEIRVSIWWNYNELRHPQLTNEEFKCMIPIAKKRRLNEFVGLTASCYLERKKGKYLQGEDKDYLAKTYCRQSDRSFLKNIEVPVANGFQSEEFFHW